MNSETNYCPPRISELSLTNLTERTMRKITLPLRCGEPTGDMDSFDWVRQKGAVNAKSDQFIILLSLHGSHIYPAPVGKMCFEWNTVRFVITPAILVSQQRNKAQHGCSDLNTTPNPSSTRFKTHWSDRQACTLLSVPCPPIIKLYATEVVPTPWNRCILFSDLYLNKLRSQRI